MDGIDAAIAWREREREGGKQKQNEMKDKKRRRGKERAGGAVHRQLEVLPGSSSGEGNDGGYCPRTTAIRLTSIKLVGAVPLLLCTRNLMNRRGYTNGHPLSLSLSLSFLLSRLIQDLVGLKLARWRRSISSRSKKARAHKGDESKLN